MNIFACLDDNHHLLLGIPSVLKWSIEATPCDGGSVLTLHIVGAKEVHLLNGQLMDLSELTIRVMDSQKASPETIGPAECVHISQLSDDISYIEVIKRVKMASCTGSEEASTVDMGSKRTPHIDRGAFYKWSKVLSYLEERFGVVTVESYFNDVVIVAFSDNQVTIETRSDFRCEVIKRRFLVYIQEVLKEIWGTNAAVEVVAGNV